MVSPATMAAARSSVLEVVARFASCLIARKAAEEEIARIVGRAAVLGFAPAELEELRTVGNLAGVATQCGARIDVMADDPGLRWSVLPWAAAALFVLFFMPERD